MKKLFGVRMSNVRDIIASLPILDLIEKNIGKTFNIISISQKCKDIIPYIKYQKNIHYIKISDYYDNLGEKDFEMIKKCEFYINPKPTRLKEKDWYNYRNLIQETCLMASFDYNKIETLPLLNVKLNKIKFNKFSIAIEKSFFDEELGKEIIIKDEVLSNLFKNEIFKNINVHFIKQKSSLKDKINIISKCHLMISLESDLSWLVNSLNITKQINLITNQYSDHTKNILAFAPPNRSNINLIYDKSSEKDLGNQIIDLIKFDIYNI